MWRSEDQSTYAPSKTRSTAAKGAPDTQWSAPDIKALADSSSLGVLVCVVDQDRDCACSILYANQGFCDLTGYAIDELEGASPKMFQSPATDRATLDRVRAALEAGRSISVELCNRNRDGETYWVSVEMIPVGRDGARLIYAAFQRDVTQERARRQALVDYVQAVQVAERETGRGFWRFDPAGDRLWLSPEARRILQLPDTGSLDDAIDLAELASVLDQPDAPAVIAGFQEAVTFAQPFSRLTGVEGRRLRFRGRLDVASGAPVLVGDIEAVTDEAALISTLEQELAAKRAAIEAKNRFLAMMSHELRTPLNAIIGFSELCLTMTQSDQAAAAKIDGYLKDILTGGRSLESVVEAVLNASRFDLGRIPMTPRVCAVRPLVEEAWRQATAPTGDAPAGVMSAEDIPSEVEVVIEMPAELRVEADPDLLRQAWSNLFANALRYGAGGRIIAGVTRTPDALIFHVENDGPIIPADLVSTFGVPFVRSDEDETRAQNKGVGLGLYICSEIAKLHGGFLYVDRERRRGARLGVALPATLERAPDSALEAGDRT